MLQADYQKKKEREKAKKQAAVKDAVSTGDAPVPVDSRYAFSIIQSSFFLFDLRSVTSAAVSKSSNGSSSSSNIVGEAIPATNSSKPTPKPVIAAVDPEQQKILEAERMAQLLIEVLL